MGQNPGPGHAQGTGLLHPTPPQGAWALRRAIADHLRQFRGMAVGAEQIIVMGHGALRVSARAFEEEVNAVEKEIREFLEE